MSVYVRKRNQSKVQFLETAKKLSSHTLTYCLKAPKRLTFFLTKDICALSRKVYYEANTANCINPRTKVEVQNRRTHFLLALAACENMELPLSELKARLDMNPEESKKWSDFAFKEWGRLLYFFNTAPHSNVYKENEKRIYNLDVRKFANLCMEIYGKTGFGLGSHTSQIYTNVVVTPLDHYIKDALGIKCYGRYVADFYFFCKNLDEVHNILDKIRKKVKELGLKLNEKKTKIQKFSKGFKFLKTKFFCTNTGKVIMKMNKKAAPRMRRKIRIFAKWIQENKFTKEQAINAYYSWRGHMIRGNSYNIISRMDKFVFKTI